MTDIHGSCDEHFARVRDVFEENFTERGDVGASVAVSVEGEFVVDLWGGHRDAAGTLPWERDTIVNVYSTTKTMTALCTLRHPRGHSTPRRRSTRSCNPPSPTSNPVTTPNAYGWFAPGIPSTLMPSNPVMKLNGRKTAVTRDSK